MFLGLVRNKKFLPTLYKDNIYEIPFRSLFDDGKRLILTDLDNTLISYKEKNSNEKLDELIANLKEMGFEIIIVSNNNKKKRVKSFAEHFNVKYLHFALKPFKFGYKRALKMASKKYKTEEVITIGDQLLTDIFSSNRMKFTSILVEAIDRKTEIITTRINRFIEKHVMKVLKKKEKAKYDEVLAIYGERHYGL